MEYASCPRSFTPAPSPATVYPVGSRAIPKAMNVLKRSIALPAAASTSSIRRRARRWMRKVSQADPLLLTSLAVDLLESFERISVKKKNPGVSETPGFEAQFPWLPSSGDRARADNADGQLWFPSRTAGTALYSTPVRSVFLCYV